jgi:hypothetical protein
VVRELVEHGNREYEQPAHHVGDEHRAAVVPAVHPRPRERREQQHGREHDVAEHAEQDRGLPRVGEPPRVFEQQPAEREVVEPVAEDRDELSPPERGEVTLQEQRARAAFRRHSAQAAEWPACAARRWPTASR